LYSGTAATRITFGSLQSAKMPFLISASKTVLAFSFTDIETWQPLSSAFVGVKISNFFGLFICSKT